MKADCTCKSGYYGDGKSCSDVDECNDVKLNDCHQSADCKNHKGGHTCSCKPGFKGDGKNNCESKYFVAFLSQFINVVTYHSTI